MARTPVVLLATINGPLLGLSDHEFMRWSYLKLIACWFVAILLQLREQRQLIRNYERQNLPNVGDNRDDIAPQMLPVPLADVKSRRCWPTWSHRQNAPPSSETHVK